MNSSCHGTTVPIISARLFSSPAESMGIPTSMGASAYCGRRYFGYFRQEVIIHG